MMHEKHAKFFVNLLGADNAYFDDAHRIADRFRLADCADWLKFF